jgi:hypothetical protein
VIEKRELVTLVSGTTGFQALKFSLNPGLPATFPLGATEAKNWTEWKCTQMRVDYIPTVSEFATQGQQGEVAIAVDYNADNALPTAMNQIEAMHFSGGGIPSKGFSFSAKTKYMNKSDPKYIRYAVPPPSDDIRLYDGGSLYFATSGCTNTTQIGKLEVTYRFELTLPTLLNNEAGGLAESSSAMFVGAGEAGGATTVAYVLKAATASGNPAFVNTAGSIVPPAGNYEVTWTTINTFSGSATSVVSELVKNAVTIQGSTAQSAFTAATQTVVTLSGAALVTANGTDAYTLDNIATYSTGSNTVSGTVVFAPV